MFGREGNYEVKVAIASTFSIGLLALATGHAKPVANDGDVAAVGLANNLIGHCIAMLLGFSICSLNCNFSERQESQRRREISHE
jgi:hypothetical protein